MTRFDHINFDYSFKENVIFKLRLNFKLTFSERSSLQWQDNYFDLLDAESIYHFLGVTLEKHQQIDHIIPVSLFDWGDLDQIKLLHTPENFQYLRADVNIEKNNKLIYNESNCPEKILPLLIQAKNNLKNPLFVNFGSKKRNRSVREAILKETFKGDFRPISKRKKKRKISIKSEKEIHTIEEAFNFVDEFIKGL